MSCALIKIHPRTNNARGFANINAVSLPIPLTEPVQHHQVLVTSSWTNSASGTYERVLLEI